MVVGAPVLLACSSDQDNRMVEDNTVGGMAVNVVPNGTSNAAGATPSTATSPLLRLTQSQYRRAVTDLLGVDATDVSLPPDGKAGLFSSNAGLPLSLLGLDQYAAAALTLATRAAPHLAELSGCSPKLASEESACVLRLIESLVPRAYRRPTNKADSEMLMKVFSAARQDFDYTSSVALLLEAVLQAPDFVYREQRGLTPQNNLGALSSYELAARLGFLLGDAIPDFQLLQAARNDELTTDEQLREQVDRLWKSNISTSALTRFHREWLALDKLDALSKDPNRYPFFDDNAGLAMRQEVDAFVEFVLHKGGGHLRTLLSAPIGFPSGSLYRVYGMIEPAGQLGCRLLAGVKQGRLLSIPGCGSRTRRLMERGAHLISIESIKMLPVNGAVKPLV